MATFHQQSVREEVNRVKAEFDLLCANEKMSKQTRMLFQSMLMLINLFIAIFLEKTTKKNSKNSSKPSSQTEKDTSSLTTQGAHGKGRPESGERLDNTRITEHVTVSKVLECDTCGQNLKNAAREGYERRTKIDIIFEKAVEHVDAEIKQCTYCDSTVKGEFPGDMPGPLQYGDGLKAYIINFIISQMVSLNRVQKMIKSMIGVIISEATFLKFIMRLYFALEQWEITATEKIRLSPSMHVDETSLRVDKKNQWIHVYSAGDITLKFLHKKRGTEAINEINIIPRYSGSIIHDCWSSYFAYLNCDHGLCGSHIVRELTYIIDSNGYAWAVNMKKLLLDTCKKVSKRKSKKLSKLGYLHLQRHYRNILTRGEKELPAVPAKPNGQRGRIAKSDAHNLWERLSLHETSVLLFAKKSEVSFTNNRAERDLRMSKVKQKVSGCFRAELYAKAYCRISSYLQTMASRGHNPLIAIRMALANEFVERG